MVFLGLPWVMWQGSVTRCIAARCGNVDLEYRVSGDAATLLSQVGACRDEVDLQRRLSLHPNVVRFMGACCHIPSTGRPFQDDTLDNWQVRTHTGNASACRISNLSCRQRSHMQTPVGGMRHGRLCRGCPKQALTPNTSKRFACHDRLFAPDIQGRLSMCRWLQLANV